MNNYIGIDFGMQNLKVCYFDGKRNTRVDLEGNQSSSSKVSKNAVFYCENEEQILNRFFFGASQAEEARKFSDPDYIRYIKRELQKEHYTRQVCGGKYEFTALQIITDIFRQIYFKMSESRYDLSAPAILTVPVVFSEAQKEMLKFCAEQSGFRVHEIITEPFAALFSDEIFETCTEDIDEDDEEYIIIFDFGASTLDICLICLKNECEHLTVETISSAGLSYGGKDITDAISLWLMDKLSDFVQEQMEAGRLDEESAKATLFEYAEEMKNELYEEEDIPETKPRSFYGSKFVLKRTNVDKILDESGIWNKISETIEDMFDCTDEFDADDYSIVTKVVMTGGTSKIQYFRDKMEEMFSNAELVGDLEEEDTIYCSVSSGAVNYARQDDIIIKNSSPMNIGISVGSGFEKVLNRNSFYNVYGKRKQISIEWLNSNDWKINVYQTLDAVREHTKLDNENILYSGCIRLDRNLYEEDEDIVIQLKQTHCGIAATTASADEITNIIEENIPLKSEVKYE